MDLLETERLVLRNLTEADADVMVAYRNDVRCAKYQRGQTKEYDGICRLIARRKQDRISVDAPFMLAIARKQTGEMVGELVVMPTDGTISMGYTLRPQHWRQGYAFEALSALTDLLHTQNPDCEFISFTDPENAPSVALLRKLGYRDMGYLPAKDSQVFGKWLTPETEAEIAQAIAAQTRESGHTEMK